MLPHISQALDLLNEKARQRRRQLDLARRTYFRALLLDDVPDVTPQSLADAVEQLELSPHDLASDAAAGETHRQCSAQIPLLNRKISRALSAAKQENPDWFPGCDPHGQRQWGSFVQTAEETLPNLYRELELLQLRQQQSRQRAPRLFSKEAQAALATPVSDISQSPATESAPNPEPIPAPEPEPAPEIAPTTPTVTVPAPVPELANPAPDDNEF
jgi:hypothetical protein